MVLLSKILFFEVILTAIEQASATAEAPSYSDAFETSNPDSSDIID